MALSLGMVLLIMVSPSLTVQDCLERRGEGVLIATDIKGAFDRCGWQRMKNRLKAKGMRRRALLLFKDYLFNRFIMVVAAGRPSDKKQIFSGVPQGGRWSSTLWGLDISEMCDSLSDLVLPFGYADDVSLWYEKHADQTVDELSEIINQDLANLKCWGDDNNTTFEKSKMEMVIVSKKWKPMQLNDITFDGFTLPIRKHMKLVGFTIDSVLSWGPMIDRIASNARARLGALARLKCYLDSSTMKMMYVMFIRSIMEYGCVAWMGAADTHLRKLDTVQLRAEKIGGFTIESLSSRRAAAAVSFSFKMLAGECKGVLNKFVPKLYEPMMHDNRISRHTRTGLQIHSKIKSRSLNLYSRGFVGALPRIWRLLPQAIIMEGNERGWLKIQRKSKQYIIKNSISQLVHLLSSE
jgi:hypothetical protein